MTVDDRGEDKHDGPDERFVRDAQRLLRRSAEELDAATLSRLKRARQDALAGYERRPGWPPVFGAAAVCATALIAVALWVGRVPEPAAPPDTTVAEPAADLEVIEDLEFYDWLEAEAAAEEAPDPGLSG